MIIIIFGALLGGLLTYLAMKSEGLLLAFIVAPFGASVSATMVALTLALMRRLRSGMRVSHLGSPRQPGSWRERYIGVAFFRGRCRPPRPR